MRRLITNTKIVQALLISIFNKENYKILWILLGGAIFSLFPFLIRFIRFLEEKELNFSVSSSMQIIIFIISTTLAIYFFMFKEKKELKQPIIVYSFTHQIFILVLSLVAAMFVSYALNLSDTVISALLIILIALYAMLIVLIIASINYENKIIGEIERNNTIIFIYLKYLKNKEEIHGVQVSIILFLTSILLILLSISLSDNILGGNDIITVEMTLILYIILFIKNFSPKRYYKNEDRILKLISLNYNKIVMNYAYSFDKLDSFAKENVQREFYNYNNNIYKILFGSEDYEFHTTDEFIERNKEHYKLFYESLLSATSHIATDKNISKEFQYIFTNHFIELSPEYYIRKMDEDKIKGTINHYSNNFIDKFIKLYTVSANDNKIFLTRNIRKYQESFIESTLNLFDFKSRKINLEKSMKIDVLIIYNQILMGYKQSPVEIMSYILKKINLLNNSYEIYSDMSVNPVRNYPEREELLLNLLFCIIKGVETSNYNISGYLIKVVISNFDTESINKCIYQMSKNEVDSYGNIQQYITENEVLSLNGKSFKYCLIKTLFLIVIFSKERKLIRHEFLNEYAEDVQLIKQIYNRLIDEYKLFGLNRDMWVDSKKWFKRINVK